MVECENIITLYSFSDNKKLNKAIQLKVIDKFVVVLENFPNNNKYSPFPMN